MTQTKVKKLRKYSNEEVLQIVELWEAFKEKLIYNLMNGNPLTVIYDFETEHGKKIDRFTSNEILDISNLWVDDNCNILFVVQQKSNKYRYFDRKYEDAIENLEEALLATSAEMADDYYPVGEEEIDLDFFKDIFWQIQEREPDFSNALNDSKNYIKKTREFQRKQDVYSHIDDFGTL